MKKFLYNFLMPWTRVWDPYQGAQKYRNLFISCPPEQGNREYFRNVIHTELGWWPKSKKEGFVNITIYVICFSLLSSKRGWVSDRSQHTFHSPWYIITELSWWEFELLFLIHLVLANWINLLCTFNQYYFCKCIIRIFILFKQLYDFHLVYLTYCICVCFIQLNADIYCLQITKLFLITELYIITTIHTYCNLYHTCQNISNTKYYHLQSLRKKCDDSLIPYFIIKCNILALWQRRVPGTHTHEISRS
jgi:hypothetical protein